MAVTGIVLALATRIMTFEETMTTIVDGFKLMSMTGAILVLAWSLGSVTKSMGLGDFVATYVGESTPPVSFRYWCLSAPVWLLSQLVPPGEPWLS